MLVGSDYSLGGSSLILLNAGLRGTNGACSITFPLRLLASQTFSNATGGSFGLQQVDLLGNTLTVLANGSCNIFGAITGTGSLIKTGPDQLSLVASNSYAGQTIVSNGVLNAFNNFALGSTAGGTVVTSNGQLNFSGTLAIAEPLQLNGAVNFSGGNSTLGGTIQLPGAIAEVQVADGSTADFNGVISGGGGLRKVDIGKLRLNANNTYTGPTQLRAGRLAINGSQPSSAVDLALPTGSILEGIGSIGTLTVATNASGTGSVRPGGDGASGALNVFGNYRTGHPLALANQLYMDLEQTTNDLLRVTGDVNLGSSTFLVLNPGVLTNGSTFTIIENLGSNSVTGTFDSLPEGSRLTIGAHAYRISYIGGTGNDVTLTAQGVPSVITSASVVTNTFHLTGLGVTNAPYVLEASTNLFNWSAIKTNSTDGAGNYFFVDPNYGLFPVRFYRVQSP